MLSQTGEYALRAVVHLAQQGRDGPLKIDEIATALDIPRNYLSKILHRLVGAGLLTSARGPTGGFRLAVAADELTLAEVVEAFDPVLADRRCLLGKERCSDAHPCQAHVRWKVVASSVGGFFRDTTVADLLDGGDVSVNAEARQRQELPHEDRRRSPHCARTPGLRTV